MRKLVSHAAHKWVKITLWGLSEAGTVQASCGQCGETHGNSQRQLFDTVAWDDGCLSEPTMDHAWPQHLNIEAQAAKLQLFWQ